MLAARAWRFGEVLDSGLSLDRGEPAYSIWQLLDIEERKQFEGELGHIPTTIC